MSHLKSHAAPKSWNFLRKVHKWVTKPTPGAHPLTRVLPISVLLKQIKCARTTKEAKKIVNEGHVLVDAKKIKDYRHGVGFMDSIQVQPNVNLRCSLDKKGRLTFIEIPKTEVKKELCKIVGKRTVKGGKTQLNLADGRNILVDKKDYKVGDGLLLEVPSQKIVEHYKLEKGNTVFLIGGRHTGVTGKIETIEGDRIWCKQGKDKIETLKKFAFLVGKDKPAIKL